VTRAERMTPRRWWQEEREARSQGYKARHLPQHLNSPSPSSPASLSYIYQSSCAQNTFSVSVFSTSGGFNGLPSIWFSGLLLGLPSNRLLSPFLICQKHSTGTQYSTSLPDRMALCVSGGCWETNVLTSKQRRHSSHDRMARCGLGVLFRTFFDCPSPRLLDWGVFGKQTFLKREHNTGGGLPGRTRCRSQATDVASLTLRKATGTKR
jgi:hypothetical protein